MNTYSIILPVHNGGEYIKECVKSILSQTYENFNLHILENCSTDGTAEWLNTITDKRVIIIPSDKFLSIEENWDRIKTIEKNEYMTMIGHDDILYPNYLETMEGLISKHPQASLYQTHFNLIDAAGIFLSNCKKMPSKLTFFKFLELMLQNNIDVTGTGFLMREKDYIEIGGIPLFPYLLCADNTLFLKLTKLSYLVIDESSTFSFRRHKSTSIIYLVTKHILGLEYFVHYLVNEKNKYNKTKEIISQNGRKYIVNNCHAITHKLIHTHPFDRKGVYVKNIVDKCNELCTLLIGKRSKNVLRDFRISLAYIIDYSATGRYIFYFFRKKIYSKPILHGK